MSEQQLRDRFAQVTELVVPAPDPYGRLMRTARRRWRHRFAALGGAIAAAVAVALLGSALPQTGTPTPSPSHGPDWIDGEPITAWTQRLLDSPVRGSLAKDKAFTSAFADAAKRRGLGPSDLTQVKVLFAGDVGPARIGAVAYRDAGGAMIVWFVNKRGADPSELAASDEQNHDGSSRAIDRLVWPMVELSSYDYRLGDEPFRVTVVPIGCVIASSGDLPSRPGGMRWTDSPDRDYSQSAQPRIRGEWRRVTCDGTVAFQDYVDQQYVYVVRAPVSETDLDAALGGAKGDVDRESARAAVNQALTHTANISGPIKVWFDGTVPGRPGTRWTIMTIPQPDGTTALFQTDVAANPIGAGVSDYFATQPQMVVREEADPDTSTYDPAHPADVPPMVGRVLAVVPPNAVRIELLSGATVLASAPVRNGIGWLEHARLDLDHTVVALDADGGVIATEPAPLPDPRAADWTGQQINVWQPVRQ